MFIRGYYIDRVYEAVKGVFVPFDASKRHGCWLKPPPRTLSTKEDFDAYYAAVEKFAELSAKPEKIGDNEYPFLQVFHKHNFGTSYKERTGQYKFVCLGGRVVDSNGDPGFDPGDTKTIIEDITKLRGDIKSQLKPIHYQYASLLQSEIKIFEHNKQVYAELIKKYPNRESYKKQYEVYERNQEFAKSYLEVLKKNS